ncbi:DUF6101 family protein [Microbaculum marinisediminis]|uniref:DUF6101 family protein n=1 Tax=Microbaculum marinisediminis TaxID=2931392 RepID=A0AAW5QTW2_9HYPH|nr:DUF6101 family protein [Microbaculum sp. A6E488]MCT8970362.1 DUF6101 family protein [Microbaculum sp. A6E488]
MRRQIACTAEVHRGASCRVRLDPFELPARVVYKGVSRAGGHAPGQHVAIVGRDSVMIRRETNAGVPLYVTVPLSAYAGVLLSVHDGPEGRIVGLTLHHRNGDLEVPLFEADNTDDVIADWQVWSRTLSRPLLIRNADGTVCEPQERLGGVIVKRPVARRANRFFAERRPKFLCQRGTGGRLSGIIYREDEIIARDIAS